MYIQDLCHEYIRVPVKKVRMRKFGRFWVVEYRMKHPRWIWDKFWWYDESLHSCPAEAAARANILALNGYVDKVKSHKNYNIESIDVKE